MPSIAVVIASLGRPETVGEVVSCLRRQSRPADRIVLSVTSEADLPTGIDLDDMDILYGSKGLCAQRNRSLELLQNDYDYIVFFDDDYVPSRYALEGIERYFEDQPGIVGISGNMLKDGIGGPGVSFDEAVKIVEDYDRQPAPDVEIIEEVDGLYGCNMAFRASTIGDKRFDENLPAYGWLEDNDFSNRLMPHGKLVYTTAFAGVHCGVKKARSPGLRLGYSQIANPVYLARKGTVTWRKALKLMSRNFLANHAKTFTPEPWVDRWGRCKGNWRALRHALTGKLSPLYILEL